MSEEALEWYRRGVEAYKASDLVEAERCFRRALDIDPTYLAAGNLGQTLVDLGKWRDAAEALQLALSAFPEDVSAETRARAEQILADAAKHVVELSIRCNVEGAVITVRGRPVGRAPLDRPIYEEDGSVDIAAAFEGYEPAQSTIDVEAGSRHEILLELKPKRQAAAVAATPSSDEPGSSYTPALVLGLGALASAAVGAVLLGIGSGHSTDAETQLAELRSQTGHPYPCAGSTPPAECADIVLSLEAHDDFANASSGLFIGAGALLGAAVVVLALTAGEAPSASSSAPAGQAPAGEGQGDGASGSSGAATSVAWQAAPWLGLDLVGAAARVRF